MKNCQDEGRELSDASATRNTKNAHKPQEAGEKLARAPKELSLMTAQVWISASRTMRFYFVCASVTTALVTEYKASMEIIVRDKCESFRHSPEEAS